MKYIKLFEELKKIEDYQNPDDYYSSNSNDHEGLEFNSWNDIFEFQARKGGANYHMLQSWLYEYFEVPVRKS